MISTLKDLDSLIRLCRKRGVDSMTIEGITFKLGSVPLKPVKPGERAPSLLETMAEPTEEELIFWSAGVTTEPSTGEDV